MSYKHPVIEGQISISKKRRKVTQTPSTTRYDIVNTLQW